MLKQINILLFVKYAFKEHQTNSLETDETDITKN
jgi:hypothetical protein